MLDFAEPLITLADGTVKQLNPFSGTEVWTVPGRGNRPLGIHRPAPQVLTPEDFDRRDAFGSANPLMTPPEKSRVVHESGAPAPTGGMGVDGLRVRDMGHGYREISGVLPAQVHDTVAEFRRVPNLFEIVTYDYWTENYGFTPDHDVVERMRRYLADDAGREHVLNIVRTRLTAAGHHPHEIEEMDDDDLLARAPGYFAGGHDVIVARRHFRDGATHDDQLASSGTLSVQEHRAFIQFTVNSIADLYRRNRYVRYVAAFQNWLKPAGASFDHLHKQLVAIDAHGEQLTHEIARLVKDSSGWHEIRGLTAEQLGDTVAHFRLFPNLFEILTYDYWHLAHGFEPTPESQAHRTAYLSTPGGRAHLMALARVRMRARETPGADAEPLDERDLERESVGLFAGNHQVVVARRHFVDGALDDWQNAGAGTLTPEEHWHYTRFTIQAVHDLYRGNPHARYVSAFQNWLRPAGASFDHLHKQLVAIDAHGEQLAHEIARLRKNPNMYNEWAVDYAARRNLIIAENDHAVAFAGFGHRYPTLEVYSKSAVCEPWLQSEAEVAAMSDLVHACHAAAGADVPCNEEWHHRPIDLDERMPWRIMIKWRVSNLAGFEGGTKIYLNTLSPWDLRDRVVPQLYRLRAAGAVDRGLRIATECSCRPNSLRYNPLVDDVQRI